MAICSVTLYHAILTFTLEKKEPFENIMGKGENAGNQSCGKELKIENLWCT